MVEYYFHFSKFLLSIHIFLAKQSVSFVLIPSQRTFFSLFLHLFSITSFPNDYLPSDVHTNMNRRSRITFYRIMENQIFVPKFATVPIAVKQLLKLVCTARIKAVVVPSEAMGRESKQHWNELERSIFESQRKDVLPRGLEEKVLEKKGMMVISHSYVTENHIIGGFVKRLLYDRLLLVTAMNTGRCI